MYSIFFQDRIVLFQFQPLSSIFSVLRGDITTHAWHVRGFMLRALQNHLYPVTFFCHDSMFFYYNTRYPLALASFNTAVMPYLEIVFIPFVDTFNVIHLFSSGMKKRFF